MKARTFALLLTLVACIVPGCDGTTGDNVAEPASVTPVNLAIEGMTCEGCVAAIEGTVQRIEGVQACVVSLEEGHAVVTVTDPEVVPTVIEKIEKMKYQARVTD